jgi:hypothetical protein
VGVALTRRALPPLNLQSKPSSYFPVQNDAS